MSHADSLVKVSEDDTRVKVQGTRVKAQDYLKLKFDCPVGFMIPDRDGQVILCNVAHLNPNYDALKIWL